MPTFPDSAEPLESGGFSSKARVRAGGWRAAESRDPRYSGAMSPLRIIGFVLIALAVLFAAASLWYRVIGVGANLSLYEVWLKFLPASLYWIQRTVWSALWNGLYIILVMPAWAVMGVLGLICIGLGRRRIE